MSGKRSANGAKTKAGEGVPVMSSKVAGIDIGCGEHWVCAPPGEDGEPNVRKFGTTTDQLIALADWLEEQHVDSVAMESTYVYWIPVYELLESRGLKVVLVNARHLSNVPSRKTDFKDCQWLQQLHSCGLLRASFRPGEAIVRMRAIQRQRENLIEAQTRHVQWMQKSLDQMNVQVHRAVSDITGTTGMAIVRAIVAGERDPAKLALHRDPRCRKSEAEITRCLTGTWREEHIFNLGSAVRLFDMVVKEIAEYDKRLLEELKKLQPPERCDHPAPKHSNAAKEKSIRSHGKQLLRTELWRYSGKDLTLIDGINATAAEIILTEVGLDLSAFPNEHHFVSWLRLCPRTPISGGKPIKKRPNSFGANRIAGVLRMAALSVGRTNTALGAEFRRIARYKDGLVAVFAVARRLAQLVYRMLRYGQDYVDAGAELYEQRFKERRFRSLQESAKALGYNLVPNPSEDLEPLPA